MSFYSRHIYIFTYFNDLGVRMNFNSNILHNGPNYDSGHQIVSFGENKNQCQDISCYWLFKEKIYISSMF